MVRKAIVPDRRRQHFPPAKEHILDAHTTEVGLEGVERAREELHRRDHHVEPASADKKDRADHHVTDPDDPSGTARPPAA